VTAKGEHPVRYKHAALAFKGYLRLFGGNDGNRLNNDIWIFRDGVTPSLTADAGDYQTVNVGAAVTLDGSGSNAGGADGMRYLWSFLTKPENSHARLKDHDTATPYFTPDVTGDYHILVTIIDPDGQTASDTVIITAVFSRQGRWIDSGGLDPHASGNPVVVIRSRSEQPVTIDLLSRSVNTSLIVMDETGEILTTATDMTRLNSGIRLTLPPGRYSVIPATLYRHRTGDFTLNIGGADLESVPVPTYRAASVGLFNTSGTSGKIEGTLTILKSLSETDIRDYLIYWGRDRNTKIDNSPFIAGLTVTGTDREFLFADPTTVPENASHLLVYSGNEQGEMPLPMSVRIGGGVFPTKIEAGSNHSCALLSSGELKCWGTGSRGQLGTGYATRLSTPVKAKTTDLMVGMTTGDSFTCAVNDKKQVDCWGRGADGRLGNGSQDDEFSPERIDSLSDIAQVTAGTFHACAVSESGHVDCWGDNNQGQLGTGDTTGHLTPVAVAGLPAVRQVSAGGFHTCALHRDGHVSCWGYGEDGQLGNNERRNQYRPVTVSGITDAVAISSGWAHNCAVLEGGSIKCWGRGSGGQLGRGSLENAETAVGVSGLSNAVEVSAGWAHTCARLRSGAVYCWGDGGYGQLGNGGLSDSVLPTPVSGINDAVQLSVGDLHTCAILSDGTAECWGYGAEGRLGDGGTQTQRVPQPVSGL
jgi:alpha-tubulin suppressor-like RCC1 family protein